MKKLFILGLLATGISFATITEANAKEPDGPEYPTGYYYKKDGWTSGGFTKLGNIISQWEILGKLDNLFDRRYNFDDK